MIVAGIGCRRGATAEAVLETLAMALTHSNIDVAQLSGLAVPEEKMHEPGIITAARKLGLGEVRVDGAYVSLDAVPLLDRYREHDLDAVVAEVPVASEPLVSSAVPGPRSRPR